MAFPLSERICVTEVGGGVGFHCLTTAGFIWRLSQKLSCLQFPD